MFEPQQLFFFLLATLLLNITPGQDTMYIIGRTLTQQDKNSPQSQQVIHGISGLAFIGMGTAIALQG